MFATGGSMSQREACLQVFRKLDEGSMVSVEQLSAWVQELTETPMTLEAVKAAAWRARNYLEAENEMIVVAAHGGYLRAHTEAKVGAVDKRIVRVRRLGRRSTNTINTALLDEKLDQGSRDRMVHQKDVLARSAELMRRREERARERCR